MALSLNLGSGKDWRKDCVNGDIQARTKPDWVVDICKINYGEIVDTRFGELVIRKEMFDKIIANDVLEHLPDLVTAMTNCRDLLKPGGEMHIHVPYDLSLGAWQDPTHVRAFNENSWLYYTDWAWYLGWEDKFELTHFSIEVSDVGQDLLNQKVPAEELMRIPRAVDAMQVILTKVTK